MITSRKNLKNTFAALCVTGTFLVCSTAQATERNWDNGGVGNLWQTADNWVGSNLPGGSHAALIDLSGANAALADATTGSVNVPYLRVGYKGTGTGELTIDGAVITSGGNDTRSGFGYGAGSAAVLNMKSGSLTFTNNNNQPVNIGSSSATSGSVYQTGGTLKFANGSGTTVSMGTTNGAGLFDFTAGTLETKEEFLIFAAGTGTSIFHVNGYDALSSIQIGGTSDDYNGGWDQRAGTTLSLSIDGGTAQGTTLINIGAGANGTHTGEATFAAGTILDLDFKSGATTGTWWTVLTAEGGITDGGFTFDDTNWDYRIVDGAGTSQSLEVTALVIPEPSSIALVLIVGGALLVTRRRKA